MEIVSKRTNVRILLEDFTCEFQCFMMYEYYLESKGKRARRKRTDDRYLLATLLNISNQHPVEKHCRLPATMPTSKKADLVSRHRACVLEGASPPSLDSYFAYQTFLQTQRARRMTTSVRATLKGGRRRGGRARESQSRYLPKKRRHLLHEMSQLHIQAPSTATITPSSAPILSPSCCSSTSTVSSISSPSPTTWQLSPLSDVGAGSEAPAVPSEAEKAAGSKKKYPCDLCDKSFDYKHVLQNHNRTHTGEKPYQCPQCHKRFTRDHHLKTHIRLHTGEKPFGCAVCHKRFVQVANLRRHERVHAGERLHRCANGHCDMPSDGDRPATPTFDCAARTTQCRHKRHRESHKSDLELRLDESSTTSAAAFTSGMPAASSSNGNFDMSCRTDKPVEDANGCLSMDIGFRVIRNNRYHQRQLGRRYETWPHLDRLSQPYQEQPEDLSIKK